MLNAVPKRLSAEDFKAYVRRFDRIGAHVLGIFRREGGQLFGMLSATGR